MEKTMIQDISRPRDGSVDAGRARDAERHRQAARDHTVLRLASALVMAGAIGFAIAVPSSTTSRDDIVAPETDSFRPQ
jgi:hypothetical protein